MLAAALLVLVTCILLVIYPFVIYPLLLKALPHRPLRPRDLVAPQTYALLFCAYNEERALPETIANLRKVKAVWPELRILAYSDCSSDRTFEILQAADDILDAYEGRERAGKPLGMRRLVEAAGTDIAIFMDANVLIDPETVRRFETYFSDPEIGAVAGKLHYVNEGESSVASIGALYWRLEERVKRLESETGSTMGADGSLFAMRRALYPQVRPDLQDDFLASMEVIFHGLRCVSAADIRAFEKGAVKSGAEFRRKRRIACGAFSTHRHMWKRLLRLSAVDRFKYVSHKMIRWFAAGFIALGLLAAIILAAGIGLAAYFFAALILGLALGAIGVRLGIGPITKIYEILAAMTATFLGVLESIFGARYATWNPVER